jgi:cephalosporin-C deacetylase-like acetyl esterase
MAERRTDVDAMWDSLDRQLEQIPLDLEQERDAFYSQSDYDVYQLHYTGLDGYRLFSWLSVPLSANGPVPALLRMPDYGSVHDIVYTPLRAAAVVMNPTHRGQRHSDAQFQAEYPGLLTEGIDRLQTFVMMRVFADALRAVDVLLAQPLAQVGPVALTGQGLGGALSLFTAARRPRITSVAADTPLALGHPEVLDHELSYPLDELNDYLRVYPHRREAILASTAPLDPLAAAPKVQVPVLLSLGSRDRGLCPLPIGEQLAARLPDCDLRVYDGGSEGGGHPHSVVREAWLRERMGLD